MGKRVKKKVDKSIEKSGVYYKVKIPPYIGKLLSKDTKNVRRLYARNEVVIKYLESNPIMTKMTWNNCKKVSTTYSQKFSKILKRHVLFLLIPINSKVQARILSTTKTKNQVEIMRLNKDQNRFYFIDEFHPSLTKSISCEGEFYTSIGWLLDRIVVFYSKKPLEVGVEYDIKACKIPVPGVRKALSSTVGTTENIYIILDYKKVEIPYKKILSPIIKYINNINDLTFQWDFDNDAPLYDEEENLILFYNTIYVEAGIAAFNLILSGGTRTKKTYYLKEVARVFDEDIISSTQIRQKGLIPSFYKTVPKLGAMLVSKHIFVCNEYFRMFTRISESPGLGITGKLKEGLNNVMEFLEHNKKTISSGKGDIDVIFEKPMIASDNMSYLSYLKHVFQEDPSLLSRYTFLVLSKESEERCRRVQPLNEYEFFSLMDKKRAKVKLTLNKMKYLVLYLRECIPKVRYDIKRINSIRRKYETHNIPLDEKSKALITGIILLNTLFKCKILPYIFTATEQDYVLFERLLIRIINDYKKTLL